MYPSRYIRLERVNPLLLRRKFISVLDKMHIPYISSLDEANHFNCYLMATDSDYFCDNLHCDYIPFESLDFIPKTKHGCVYLKTKTLALACSLYDEAIDYLLKETYLNSTNELYRFRLSNNSNSDLHTNSIFIQLTQSYVNTLHMNNKEIKDFIDEILQNIKNQYNHSLPLFFADAIITL
ncbi:hypothetical protein I4U23_022582 [Adineta vaga]|nr:hypothetical protein I4U23_022582 [Adineta vaga]